VRASDRAQALPCAITRRGVTLAMILVADLALAADRCEEHDSDYQ
jgi:hypothetical protein